MYQRERADWSKYWDFMLGDIIVLQISYVIGYYLRFPDKAWPYLRPRYATLILVFSLVQIMATLILNNHHNIFRRGWMTELIQVCLLAFATLALVSLFLYSMHTAQVYSRLHVYYTVAIFIVLDYGFRVVWKHSAGRKLRYKSGKTSRSILLVTEAESAGEIINDLQSNRIEPYNIVGMVLTDSKETPTIRGVETVCTIAEVRHYVCREWVDEVFIYLPDGSALPADLISACAEMGVTVHTVLNLQSVERNKQFIEGIGGRTVLTTAYNYIAPYQAFAKRLMDIAGGIVGSIIAILIIIFIGPVIYFNSPGPILFKQQRIGKNGKRFTLLKLRSMYLDAEERKKDFLAQNRVGDGMMFKLDFDPRIIGNRELPDGTRKTGIGEFIRKTSLDEFPQFFNVLKGDMSLVGTRPPTVDEWEKYEYHHRARLAIKPGITGMWQVSGRSEITDFEEVVKLDTEYILKFRISLDIKILFKTIKVLFTRKGAM